MVFWDVQRVIYKEYLLKGHRTNADIYAEMLFNLQKAIKVKKPGLLSHGVIVLHDNARLHTATILTVFLKDFKWEVLGYPPYSPYFFKKWTKNSIQKVY